MDRKNSTTLTSLTQALGLALVAALLLAASPSRADDKKIYPASGCVPASHMDRSKLYYGADGSVRNYATSQAWIVCPITRDVTTERWDTWVIAYDDRHESQDIYCTLQEVSTFLTTSKIWSMRTSGIYKGKGLRFENISCAPWENCIGAPYLAPTQHYSMRCTIPARSSTNGTSALHGYEFTED